MDDVRELLRQGLGGDDRPPPDLYQRVLRAASRRGRRRRLSAAVTAGTACAVAAAVLWLAFRHQGPERPLVPTQTATATPSASETPSPSPSGAPGSGPREFRWPPPFAPHETVAAGRATIHLTFPDGSTASLSYAADLHLARHGVQPGVSYVFLDDPAPRHQIMFLHGPVDPALFASGAPVRSYADGRTLWEASPGSEGPYRPEGYWLVSTAGDWTVLVSVPDLGSADEVAGAVRALRTSDGFAVIDTGPSVALSDVGGEGEGPSLTFWDTDPRRGVSRFGPEFRLIELEPLVRGTCRESQGNVGGDTRYAGVCLADGAIFAHVYGPPAFVVHVAGTLKAENVHLSS